MLAVLLLAGCLQASSPQGDSSTPQGLQLDRPVVVALLDTGINPYQPIFRTSERIDYSPYAVRRVLDISLGMHPDEGRKLDAELWSAFELGELYAINGTRLMAISFAEGGKEQPIDYLAHGAGTSYIAARDAPDVLIVMVQVNGGLCQREECPANPDDADPSIAEGMAWIAEQPWIDVVSISLGNPGNAPDPSATYLESVKFREASRRAAEAGKVLVIGGGNAPPPPMMNHYGGVPWAISVGGYEPSSHGQQTVLGTTTGFDVLANYTEYIGNFHDMGTFRGTSYATPNVAATLAEALHIVRANGREASAAELREALNASAILFDADGWDPTAANESSLGGYASQLSAPFLLPTQQGWGYVNASLAPEIARRVLEQDFAPTQDKSTVALYQERYQAAREQYWQNPP